MKFICNSFVIHNFREFRVYDEFEKYISNAKGFILGEDASNYDSYHSLDIDDPFKGTRNQIGLILEDRNKLPSICPVHETAILAIGMNSCVQFVNLKNTSEVLQLKLDSVFHNFLCSNEYIVAIHELGAVALKLPGLQEIANVDCEIVAYANLSGEILTVESMDGELTEVNLALTR